MKHLDDSLSLKIPHEMRQQIEQISQDNRRSLNATCRLLIRLGLDTYTDENGKPYWRDL